MKRVPLKFVCVPLLSASLLGSGSFDGQASEPQVAAGDPSLQDEPLAESACAANDSPEGRRGCASDRSFAPIAEFVPPGTLGQTYQRVSRPVPAHKHPCVGMIDVYSPKAEHVIVRWTNDFRTEETLKGARDECHPAVWHFESKPLIPGLSQIYRVEIYQNGPGTQPTDVRYVRLIMGRIVYLSV